MVLLKTMELFFNVRIKVTIGSDVENSSPIFGSLTYSPMGASQ